LPQVYFTPSIGTDWPRPKPAFNIHAFVKNADDFYAVLGFAEKNKMPLFACASVAFADVVTGAAKVWICRESGKTTIKRAEIVVTLHTSPSSASVTGDVLEIL